MELNDYITVNQGGPRPILPALCGAGYTTSERAQARDAEAAQWRGSDDELAEQPPSPTPPASPTPKPGAGDG